MIDLYEQNHDADMELVDKVMGYDNKLVDLEDRLAHTPTGNRVVWSGERGQSIARPTDKHIKKLLKDKGVEGIKYGKDGEPNFRPVSEGYVKITDMSSKRNRNFSSADKAYAKKIGCQPSDVVKMRRERKLTWHEESNTETMCLVSSDINSYFGHAGGVSECAQFEAEMQNLDKSFYLSGDFLMTSNRYYSNILSVGVQGGVDVLKGAIIPILIEGTTNLVRVSAGEMTMEEAVCDVGKMTARITAGGASTAIAKDFLLKNSDYISSDLVKSYLTAENVGNVIGVASMIANTTIRYTEGEISEQQFFSELLEKGIVMEINKWLFHPCAGYALTTLPGAIAFIGSMLVSCACSYVVDVFRSFDNYKSDIGQISQIIGDAEHEIQQIEKQLAKICSRELREFENKVEGGYEAVMHAALRNDIAGVENGMNTILSTIGEKVIFSGMSRTEFCKQLFDK